jgi:hypothetical protein
MTKEGGIDGGADGLMGAGHGFTAWDTGGRAARYQKSRGIERNY